ncbi:MAG TPA: peptide chain release factor 2 [Blastocatellia bacterium]|nr:peptide chain release factor 2 [Blastocatellia bacterium]
MIEELRQKYEDLAARAAELGGFFDPQGKASELQKSEAEIGKPDFWNDQDRAQKVLKQRSRLQAAIDKADQFQRDVEDAVVLLEFAAEDQASLKELQTVIERLEREVEEAETEMLLSGPNDTRDAIVTINAGAGGTDAQDWAEILLRMYLRWAERRGFKTDLVDEQPGKEAGIKGATFTVAGEYAYGLLSAEAGVHRLVRLSPFNAGSSRETSFASVFVYPEIEDDVEIEINEKDLRVDTYRSSGAGGQHVNVTDSAVRITHLPSGIVVTCQNQRSQHQNREVAMHILKSRLYELELEKKRAETAQLEETKRDISFGSQIRNYVLHPYRLAKDVRTKHETADVDAVLDGDLDEFIKQYLMLKSRASREAATPETANTPAG